jgi:hypothetical protein
MKGMQDALGIYATMTGRSLFNLSLGTNNEKAAECVNLHAVKLSLKTIAAITETPVKVRQCLAFYAKIIFKPGNGIIPGCQSGHDDGQIKELKRCLLSGVLNDRRQELSISRELRGFEFWKLKIHREQLLLEIHLLRPPFIPFLLFPPVGGGNKGTTWNDLFSGTAGNNMGTGNKFMLMPPFLEESGSSCFPPCGYQLPRPP